MNLSHSEDFNKDGNDNENSNDEGSAESEGSDSGSDNSSESEGSTSNSDNSEDELEMTEMKQTSKKINSKNKSVKSKKIDAAITKQKLDESKNEKKVNQFKSALNPIEVTGDKKNKKKKIDPSKMKTIEVSYYVEATPKELQEGNYRFEMNKNVPLGFFGEHEHKIGNKNLVEHDIHSVSVRHDSSFPFSIGVKAEGFPLPFIEGASADGVKYNYMIPANSKTETPIVISRESNFKNPMITKFIKKQLKDDPTFNLSHFEPVMIKDDQSIFLPDSAMVKLHEQLNNHFSGKKQSKSIKSSSKQGNTFIPIAKKVSDEITVDLKARWDSLVKLPSLYNVGFDMFRVFGHTNELGNKSAVPVGSTDYGNRSPRKPKYQTTNIAARNTSSSAAYTKSNVQSIGKHFTNTKEVIAYNEEHKAKAMDHKFGAYLIVTYKYSDRMKS